MIRSVYLPMDATCHPPCGPQGRVKQKADSKYEGAFITTQNPSAFCFYFGVCACVCVCVHAFYS